MSRWPALFAGGPGVSLLLAGTDHGCEVVAVRFRRRMWTRETAVSFLADHDMRHTTVERSRSSLTFRQTSRPLSEAVEYGKPTREP